MTELILKDGDYYTLEGVLVPLEKVLKATLIKQEKKDGQLIFNYEFPKRGRKKAVKVDKKKKVQKGAIDPEQNVVAEDSEQIEKIQDVQPEGLEEETQPTPRKYATKTKLLIKQLEYIDDPDVGVKDKEIHALARIKPKPNAPTKHQWVKLRCAVCNGEEVVPKSEADFFKGMLHRCNRCMGGR